MGWYEALKDAVTVAEQLENAELKQKLADVQVECAKLAEENARLRQELIELREQAQTRQEMEYHDNVYWRQPTGGKREGPFCPKCLDGDRKKARMSDSHDNPFWNCPVCDYGIRKPGTGEWRSGRAETDYDPFSS